MKVAAVNRTIRALCAEVNSSGRGNRDWQLLTEEELLYEACVCMFSSQLLFEVAVAAAERLKERGLLRVREPAVYEQRLAEALAEPLVVEQAGKFRQVRPRFKNRWVTLLATTTRSMDEQGKTMRGILLAADSARKARELLVKEVWGFGPKQASLFLRRVGYCSELAVLDTHILDYLRVARGIMPSPGALSRLSGYEHIEAEFQKVATDFGHPVGCVDLAMWVTMRVAKRESIW